MTKKYSLFLVLGVAATLCFLPSSVLTGVSESARYENRKLASTDSGSDLSSNVNLQMPGGAVFHGAALPFGMMMWGPHAPLYGALSRGYSLTALSGAEMWDYYIYDVPILPTTQEVGEGDVIRPQSQDGGSPGHFHSVQSDGVEVDLTTTVHAGLGRFKFNSDSKSIIFSLGERIHEFKRTSNRSVEGTSQRKERPTITYFIAEFDRPFLSEKRWNRKRNSKKAVLKSWEKPPSKFSAEFGAVQFAPGPEPVLMRIGMSHVSMKNARMNLTSEIQSWDFDAYAESARNKWNDALSRIAISGGTPAERSLFYSALYFALLHPNTASDVNGEYVGFDDKIHKNLKKVHYANFSGWDIYRTWVPLMALIYPDRVSAMMQSLVDDSAQCGAMPRWPVDAWETGTMESGSATPIIANAYAFGAHDFSLEEAFRSIDRTESIPQTKCQELEERPDLEQYLKLGYLPLTDDRVGQMHAMMTLDYAIGDFAASRVANFTNHASRVSTYLKLAQNWRNLMNSSSRLIQPRDASGSWSNGFSPQGSLGFAEGTSIQYSWMVPFNLQGLFTTMGGKEKVVQRLDQFFTKLNDGPNSQYAFIGNEPSMGIPWEYNWAGAPWKAQEVVRRAIYNVFMNGFAGADDLGTMSSWIVWSMLGLYPEIPGVGGLAVTSPVFPRATLNLPAGKLEIVADGASRKNSYIENGKLNSASWTSSWLPLDKLKAGDNSLHFTLGDSPNRAWGTAPEDTPPSYDSDR